MYRLIRGARSAVPTGAPRWVRRNARRAYRSLCRLNEAELRRAQDSHRAIELYTRTPAESGVSVMSGKLRQTVIRSYGCG
jgi:hypothetical protein